MIDIIIPTFKKYTEVAPLVTEITFNTPEPHRIIATCQEQGAAINRNIGLKLAPEPFCVMLDDDITQFYPYWLTDLIVGVTMQPEAIVCAARLTFPRGLLTMGVGPGNREKDLFVAENDRVATGCIAINRKALGPITFDEEYIGSGYEDTDFMQQIKRHHGPGRVWVNNRCQLMHLNEMKLQGGEAWRANHAHYMRKWPRDMAVKNQEDWTETDGLS